jgi:hypothetical protein
MQLQLRLPAGVPLCVSSNAANINTRVFINQSEEGEVDKYPLPIGYAVIYYGLPVIDWTMD